jgi:Flp pilus assembly protein TadD
VTGADHPFARVIALLEVNRPAQALDELGRLPATVATSRTAFQLRAAALTALERWPDVAAMARQGLAESGPDAELLGRLGVALRHQGDYVPAERSLLDSLALEPRDPWLLCQYADLCCTVGQIDKAERLVALAAAEEPEGPGVFAARFQIAYARGDDRTAARVAREFLGVWPEHPSALALHGVSAAERGRMTAAARSFGQAVAHDPNDADAADAAWEFRVYAHPLLLPLRPLYRLGVFRTWLIAIGTLVALNLTGFYRTATLVGFGWLLLCVYSWIAPSLVRRLVRRRWRA